jgi:hypothetical protein
VATITSGDPTATSASFAASINWGDGTTSAGTVTVDAKRGLEINGSHTYAKAGQFAVSVTVNQKSTNAKAQQVTFAFVRPAPSQVSRSTGQRRSSSPVRTVGTVTRSAEGTLRHAPTNPLRITAFSPAFNLGTGTPTVLAPAGDSAAAQVTSFTAALGGEKTTPLAPVSETVTAESQARIRPSQATAPGRGQELKESGISFWLDDKQLNGAPNLAGAA